MIVLVSGQALGEPREVNGVEQTCYDLGMSDPLTEKVLGRATACLDHESLIDVGAGGFAVDDTTFFRFPGGTLVSSSRATVQPLEEPTEGHTHITGDTSEDANVIPGMGSGRFRQATGSTRLSGTLDLSQFDQDIVGFEWLFVIKMEPPSRDF
jgi:hypothetical protein